MIKETIVLDGSILHFDSPRTVSRTRNLGRVVGGTSQKEALQRPGTLEGNYQKV